MADNDTFDRKALLQMLPLLLILVSGAFITILNQTLLGTALPVIMVDLDLSESTVQWLQSICILVIGIMMTLLQTSMFLMFPVNRRGTAMGIFGLVIAFAPAIGPTLSGYLVESFHWRSVFYVIFPIAVINLIAAYFYLKNVTEQKDVRV